MDTLTNLETELRRVEFDPQSNKLVYQPDKLHKKFTLVWRAYETLLEALEECKTNAVLAKFSIDVKKQLKNFEEEYPEVVSEYYLKHRP